MNVSLKPRYLLLAVAAGAGLYLAGVSLGTVLILAAAAYMLSMHLGGHGGNDEHGGKEEHGGRPTDPTETGEPSGTTPPAKERAHHH